MTRTNNVNPLVCQHAKKILRRGQQLRNALHHVWGITWNLRGRKLCRLGSASMMAMSYHPSERGDVIETLCVVAQTDPQSGVVHYSDIRMAHDFARSPCEGARDRVLDPREEGTRTNKAYERPNASWVRLALELDRQACRSVTNNWKLPVVPVLPTFYAGYTSMDAIDLEITPAMKRLIATHMGRSIGYLETLPEEDLKMLARAHWADLWIAPGIDMNDSNLWLINTDYTTQLVKSPRLYEDFSQMMGVDCFNPARELTEVYFHNPVRDCAETQGIDLDGTLAVIRAGEHAAAVQVAESIDEQHDFLAGDYDYDDAEPMTPTEFVCDYDEAVDRLLLLRNCVRGTLGAYSQRFSDEEINFCVVNPDLKMKMNVESALYELGQETAVRLAREYLREHRPLVNAGATDADLVKALENPHAPLYASQLCGVQIMRRDTRIDAADAFRFDPLMLNRDRVYANIWAGAGWTPRTTNMEHYAEPRQSKGFYRQQVTYETNQSVLA